MSFLLASGVLLVIPNQPRELLTSEPDGSKRDFAPLIEAAGYRLTACEPVLADEGVRELLGVHDHFFLFERRPAHAPAG